MLAVTMFLTLFPRFRAIDRALRNIGKQNCTAEVQDYSSAVHFGNRCGKDPEVPEGSVANGSTVRIRVLVNYIGSWRHMNRIGNEQKLCTAREFLRKGTFLSTRRFPSDSPKPSVLRKPIVRQN